MAKTALLIGVLCACVCTGCTAHYALPALVLRAAATKREHTSEQADTRAWEWLLSAGLAFRLGKDPLHAPFVPAVAEVSNEPAAESRTTTPCTAQALCRWEQAAGDVALAQLAGGG
ncbi:MAG TPA: hypothetical protein VF331_00270 [Polyangiales bacterium]